MTESRWHLPIGAHPESDGVHFRVWAPGAQRVDVVIYGPDAEKVRPLSAESGGYFAGWLEGIGAGTRYRFRLDGADAFPDPASRFQPDGVHGTSEVVDAHAFTWTDDAWAGRTLEEMVIYELHVGTFTPGGTFDSAIERFGDLVELGVTAIEVMPIANFPGSRNWGYDGVNLYAPATAYGGPLGFKRLVDAAHGAGLAVILDVVYNHLGPEGNYLPATTSGRFFTDRHKTPWGDAIAYDGEHARPVRDFVVHNALHWVHEYHVDGLRLDATHAIIDDSPVHLLRELAERVHSIGPVPRTLIAEDERNERRLVLSPEQGGYGLDAVWADDLHHQLRRHTAGDREGYFAAYTGSVQDIAATLRKGWFYEGQHAPHRGEARGTPASGIPRRCFVHCIQNHDQVGNRPFGDRLTEGVSPGVYRALSTLLLLSPYTPMLWMGQEWGATSPFLYFTDHPEELGKLVTEGRREEFKHFSAFSDPHLRERIPDPQAEETFERSKLRWDERQSAPNSGILGLYRELIRIRSAAARKRESSWSFDVHELGADALALRLGRKGGPETIVAVSFAGAVRVDLGEVMELDSPVAARIVLATEEERFGGTGSWGELSSEGVLRLSAPGAVVLSLGSG